MARIWKNWAGNQSCRCDMPSPPRDLSELKSCVSSAVKAGKRIRVAGGSYSWSELVTNEGEVIIEMSRLDRVLSHGVSESGDPTVTVECGISIEALTGVLKPMGLTLVTPTLFPKPTVGGVISTGAHGVGFSSGNFSDQITEMCIVRADGSDTVVRRGYPDHPAAQVALGTLGVVYSVTLEVKRDFRVFVDKRRVPVDYVLEEFDDLQQTYEFIEIFWFPLQNRMWLYLMNRTSSPPDPRSWWSRLLEGVVIVFQEFAAGAAIPWIAKHAPLATPMLNRLASRLSNREESSVQLASDAFHHQKAYAYNWDISYAVPAECAAEAWKQAIDLTKEFARAERYPANLAFHCRFTGPSEAWLAPNHGRNTVYIEVATAKGTPRYEEFFREIERRWSGFGPARPHWGKLFWKFDRIPDAYPKFAEFAKVREAWDPDRVFLNRFLEREIFGLESEDAAAMPQSPEAESEADAVADVDGTRVPPHPG